MARELSDTYLDSLQGLVHSPRKLKSLSRSSFDKRFATPQAFEQVLCAELDRLWRWSITKFATQSDLDVKVTDSVLCLMPHYATALHLLRRAVPFAAFGCAVTVAFGNGQSRDDAAVTTAIAKALGLEEAINKSNVDAKMAADAHLGRTVVLTGKRKTAALLAAKGHRLLGATGRCAVVASSSRDEYLQIRQARKKDQILKSCSRIRAGLVCEDKAVGKNGNVQRTLNRLNPSVVLIAPSLHDRAVTSYGFAKIACDHDGLAADHVGFAADPNFGWPGDYAF